MRRFSEHQTSNNYYTYSIKEFFIACILLPLLYLHKENIIHRDLKPENLVLDDRGYIKLTDMGIARSNNKNNSNDTSGTPGYMGNNN
jgi:serine/threonine protein kinase